MKWNLTDQRKVFIELPAGKEVEKRNICAFFKLL